MKAIELPSGAKLEIQIASFAESKSLFQAIAKELKGQKIDGDAEADINFIKDLLCAGISSKEVDEALSLCARRCLYRGMKIDKDSFESEDSRQDYFKAMFEIGKANIEPFMKPLFADLKALLPKILDSQAAK